MELAVRRSSRWAERDETQAARRGEVADLSASLDLIRDEPTRIASPDRAPRRVNCITSARKRGKIMYRLIPECVIDSALRIVFVGLVVGILSGCAATRGGPKSFLTVESAAQSLDVRNIAMSNLAEATTADARNMHLSEAMSDVDVLYVEYRDTLLRSDNAFNASIDLLSLGSVLAGTLTESAGVKNNYLTLGALLGGTRATVNNRFLYAQTGLALIKGMDAARAATALSIKRKQSALTIQEYSGRDAYSDALKYYFDGTLAGGLIWLQANAEEQESVARQDLATLSVPTPQQLRDRESLYDRIGDRFDKPDSLKRALGAWGISTGDDESLESLQEKFSDEYRRRLAEGAETAGLEQQLTDAKFFED